MGFQGLRYIGAYSLSFLPTYTLSGYTLSRYYESSYPPTAVIIIAAILSPLLGFFNSIVYFRPRYLAYKEAHPNDSRIKRLGKIVFNVDVDNFADFSLQSKQRDKDELAPSDACDLGEPLVKSTKAQPN